MNDAVGMAVDASSSNDSNKEKGKGKVAEEDDIVQELIKLLTNPVLQNSGELREVCGFLYTTFLVEVVSIRCKQGYRPAQTSTV